MSANFNLRHATTTSGVAPLSLVATVTLLVGPAPATGVDVPFPPYDPVTGNWSHAAFDSTTTRIDFQNGYINLEAEGKYSGTLPTQIAFLSGLTVRERTRHKDHPPQS